METTELGASIRQARVAAALTQVELAEKIGSTQSVLARWERNGVEPLFSTVLQIAEATGPGQFRLVPVVDPHDRSLVATT